MSVKHPPTPSRWSELDQAHISPPKISLDQALASWFVYQDRAYEVARCPVAILKQLVSTTIKGRGKRELQELPILLDGDVSDLTRWYVIDTLLTYKVLKRSYFVEAKQN